MALWIVRAVLLVSVLLHITAAYQLTLMNRRARPVNYAAKKSVETTLAATTMRIGGVLLLVFIIFHLMHFTLGIVGFQPGQFVDLAVYQNVVAGFSVLPVALFYILAMCALFLHLDHGIWSATQTLGWNTADRQSRLRGLSRLIAALISIGFVSVPLAVMAGWVR
jgi:succinate dehydrogenase / fumarate reductase cytochrome b subunit